MSSKKELTQYSKFLSYVLGHQPSEFGLVPDSDGYIKIKELLKAVTEESGWKFFRKSHIDELMVSIVPSPLETSGSAIRVKSREHLKARSLAPYPPKLLYTAIRRKAYPAALEKGILPIGRRHVILSSDKAMAERIGRRIDPKPVILSCHTQKARREGCLFYQAGEQLFLTTHIPVDCFTGPALPKESREPLKKEPDQPAKRDRTPGSFFPDLKEVPENHRPQKQRRPKEIGWKQDRKRLRRR